MYPWDKNEYNYFSIKFISKRIFFSQSLQSHPDNTLHIKTGLQGFKYLRNGHIYLTPGVPVLPLHILYECLRDCKKKHSDDMGANDMTTYSATKVENKFKVFSNFLKNIILA